MKDSNTPEYLFTAESCDFLGYNTWLEIIYNNFYFLLSNHNFTTQYMAKIMWNLR